MSHRDGRHQIPLACPYPPPPASSSPPVDGYKGSHVMAPPPMGYPAKDGCGQGQVPAETTTRGEGFWKGCVAGLCCCWCVDICF